MIASAGARAHHVREEKISREEASKRSQQLLAADEGDSKPKSTKEKLDSHYLLVPFKDCDYGLQDGQVSRK